MKWIDTEVLFDPFHW